MDMDIIAMMNDEGDSYSFIDSEKLTAVIKKIRFTKSEKKTKKLWDKLRMEVINCIDYKEECSIGSDNEVDYWFANNSEDKEIGWMTLGEMADRFEEIHEDSFEAIYED